MELHLRQRRSSGYFNFRFGSSYVASWKMIPKVYRLARTNGTNAVAKIGAVVDRARREPADDELQR